MRINMNVKIKGGFHTPIDVDVYCTAVNEKVMKFANGQSISDTKIAVWIKTNLKKALKEMQNS